MNDDEKDNMVNSVSRIQQVLAIFFQTFFAAGEDREKVAWESVSDLIADVTGM